MGLIVLKFGGTSVATPEKIMAAAGKVVAEIARGNRVVVVVSAMSGVTNQLVDYCKTIDPHYDVGEGDAVTASGEQVTAGLMALSLRKLGHKAQSLQGWQVPIKADAAHGRARVLTIPDKNLRALLAFNIIPVVAGFQGVTHDNRVATLGRGGSDTSAVAVAAALKADRCDIYTDVDGVYTTDPRVVPLARKLTKISYEEMLELATMGAKVLMNRSVELAMKWRVPLQVLSTFARGAGSDLSGTMVVAEQDILEQEVVNGVAFSRNEAKITLMNVPDRPGVAANVFGPLAQANINVDMIVQNIAADGKTTDLTFTVARVDAVRAITALKDDADLVGCDIRLDDKVAKISVIGIGMASHAGVASTMFRTLFENNINIQVISTSEIKISVLIDEEYTDTAVKALHTAYDLAQSSSHAPTS
jgi:aspartate kinase